MSKSNQIQLSDHFTTGRLLKFTASPIIMMIFTSIYTIVDGFFVSNYAGKTAFTALNLIYPYLQMLGCLGFMIGTGGSALVAMTLGAGDEKRANRLFSMLAVATAVLGVLFSAFGLALLEPVAVLLGATPELLPSCLLYGRILLTFQTAFMLQYLFQSFFIAAEKPKLGLFFTVAAGATNMVLDFVLVGVAGLGLAGAAAATVISQMVGGVAPIFYFIKRRPGCRLYFTKPLFSLRELFKACTNGASELMTNISMSLVSALYNMQLLKLFGADGVAAYGVLMYVGFVFAAVFIGYSQGTAPIVSYHFGADNKDELKNLLRKSAGIIAVAGVAMLASSELLAGPLAKIFVGYDAGLLALTIHGMKLYSISFILSGFNIFGSAFFTALNNGTVSAAISFLRTLLFQVVSILTLPLMVSVTENALKDLPPEYTLGSLGLGASKWQTIWNVLLPACLPRIMTGLILAAGRGFGEAAALMFTAGMSTDIDWGNWDMSSTTCPLNPFRPGETLALHVWVMRTEALSPDAAKIAGVTSAILMLVVVLFNVLARYISWRLEKKMEGTADD